MFGPACRPDPYIEEDLLQRMRSPNWYLAGRQIVVHDIYSFDPNVHVELEEFTDIIGATSPLSPSRDRGYDNGPVAHMCARDDHARRSSLLWFRLGDVIVFGAFCHRLTQDRLMTRPEARGPEET